MTGRMHGNAQRFGFLLPGRRRKAGPAPSFPTVGQECGAKIVWDGCPVPLPHACRAGEECLFSTSPFTDDLLGHPLPIQHEYLLVAVQNLQYAAPNAGVEWHRRALSA